MVLDTALLNTQHYKVGIQSKVEQSRKMSSALPIHLGVVAFKKEAFGLPSTKVVNFYLLLILEVRELCSLCYIIVEWFFYIIIFRWLYLNIRFS